MRVIALPSIYEREHARVDNPARRKRRLLIWLIGGVVVCAVIAIINRSEALYCVLALLGWCTTIGMIVLVTSVRPVSQGESGEQAALAGLSGLPDTYTAVTNCKIQGYEQIGDLDIVVIGRSGVIVIEVKNLHQPILVDGDSWTAVGHAPRPIKSVSKQLDNQVRALRKSLGRAGLNVDVSGVIALNPNSSIQIQNPPSYPIVTYDNLAETIEGQAPTREQTMLSENRIEAIIKHLSGLSED